MSNAVLKGNASGTGTVTLETPNTNSDFTISLPAVTGSAVIDSATQTLTNKTLTSPTLTTPNINSAQIATVSGTAPLYMCRAWVNFNGTTSPGTIRASGNVSSVTRNGTGDYTINFTTAMPDANYTLVGVSRPQTSNNSPSIFAPFVSSNGSNFTHVAPTTSAARVVSGNGAVGGTFNSDYIMVAIFR
jgi:hypothetical protein